MAEPPGGPERLRAAITAVLQDSSEGTQPIQRICQALADALPVDGASISVMTSTQHRETLYASDTTIGTIEETQFTLGEGPCFQAFHTGRPVLVPDLAAAPTTAWPIFAATISQHPVRAIFALPIAVGAIRAGALDMYRAAPGPLSAGDLATALHVADAAAAALLQLRAAAPADQPPPDWLDLAGPGAHPEVHQATGMLAHALHIPADQAFARLRAHAFTTGNLISETARDIVTRRLRPEDLEH